MEYHTSPFGYLRLKRKTLQRKNRVRYAPYSIIVENQAQIRSKRINVQFIPTGHCVCKGGKVTKGMLGPNKRELHRPPFAVHHSPFIWAENPNVPTPFNSVRVSFFVSGNRGFRSLTKIEPERFPPKTLLLTSQQPNLILCLVLLRDLFP